MGGAAMLVGVLRRRAVVPAVRAAPAALGAAFFCAGVSFVPLSHASASLTSVKDWNRAPAKPLTCFSHSLQLVKMPTARPRATA